MKKATVMGKTVDEAIAQALRQLGTTRDKVDVHVLEEPSRGIFGLIGTRDAKVEVVYEVDPVAEAYSFLTDVLMMILPEAKVEQRVDEEHVIFNITGDGLGLIIGKRGQTLDSLQYLCNLVGNKSNKKFVKIVLDAEDYREKRKNSLEQLAERLANQVVRTGKSVKLEPMTALERKIIHTCLQNRSDVTTFSEGQDPNRYIVIDLN